MDRIIKNITDTAKAAAKGAAKAAKAAGSAGVSVGSGKGEKTGKGGKKVIMKDSIKAANDAAKAAGPAAKAAGSAGSANESRKTILRLTESDLHRIVKESVQKILNEVTWTDSEGNIHKDQHGTDPEAWDKLENERRKRIKIRTFPTIDQGIETAKNFSGAHRNEYNAKSLRGRGNSMYAKAMKSDADHYRDEVNKWRGMKNG